MLEGIEILSQVEKVINRGSMIGFGIFFGILAVICIILVIRFNENGVIFFVGVGTFCLFLSIFGFVAHNPTTEKYIEYKVSISNQVSLTEFNEKYKILNQEGKIYTIREKENQN